MLLRRLVPLAAVVVVGLVSTGCADQSAAVKVGDKTYSDADFRAELDAVAGSETLLGLYEQSFTQQQLEFPAVEGAAEGSYNQQFVSLLLGRRLDSLLVEELLDREGVEITEADLDTARTDLESAFEQSGGDFSDLPKGYRDQLVAESAAQTKFQDSGISEETVQEFVAEQLPSVEINSRYGSFDPNEGLLPPAGPLISDDESSDELQSPSG